MQTAFFVYILASKRNGTLYVGVTNDLARRMAAHKAGLVPGFTKQYGVTLLVYFEAYGSIIEARAREHSLKRWRRAWTTRGILSRRRQDARRDERDGQTQADPAIPHVAVPSMRVASRYELLVGGGW